MSEGTMNYKDLDELFHVFGVTDTATVFDESEGKMNGTIVRMMGDKGFGFLRGEDGREHFFHRSSVNGFFEDWVVDIDSGRKIQVTFDEEYSAKGPRATNVTRVDWPNQST
jgi:cold shock protein